MELTINVRGTLYDNELYTEEMLIGKPMVFNGKTVGNVVRVDLKNKYVYAEIDDKTFEELFIDNEPKDDIKTCNLHFNLA